METTTVGFIGLGLIGGSIAKAIKKFHPDYQILAYNRTKSVLDDAVFDGIVDVPCVEKDNTVRLFAIISSSVPLWITIWNVLPG